MSSQAILACDDDDEDGKGEDVGTRGGERQDETREPNDVILCLAHGAERDPRMIDENCYELLSV